MDTLFAEGSLEGGADISNHIFVCTVKWDKWNDSSLGRFTVYSL